MSQFEADLAIALLAGHLVSDFLLQTDQWVKAKKRIVALTLHCVLVAALSYALSGVWALWWVPLAIFGSHLLIDFGKVRFARDTALSFVVDQLLHLLVIGLLVYLAPLAVDASSSSSWQGAVGGNFYPILLLVAGLVATTHMGSVLVGLWIQAFPRPGDDPSDTSPKVEGDADHKGFEKGGKTIGQLERAITFALVLAGQPTGIGFLIAAKSLLRFGEIGAGGNRKEVEYIILGTFMSFLIAIAFSYLAKLGFDSYRTSFGSP